MTNQEQEDIDLLRKYVNLGIKRIFNITLEELEKRSGPLSKEEIIAFGKLGMNEEKKENSEKREE